MVPNGDISFKLLIVPLISLYLKIICFLVSDDFVVARFKKCTDAKTESVHLAPVEGMLIALHFAV